MEKASKDDIPLLSCFFENRDRSMRPNRLTWTKRVRKEKYSPAAIRSTTSPGFHTMAFI